jgi:cytochrome c oxidase assembly factor CtaG
VNPELSDAIAASWTVPVWPTLALLLTGLIYWRGWRLARLTRPAELPPWRAACFYLGLAAAWLAIASPLDALGGLLLLAHMAQHLVLMSVVPPLLLLGNPQVPLLRGLPRAWVRDAIGPFFAAPGVHALGRFLTHPVTAWLAMNLAYLGWHVPVAYELALRSSTWHEVEHACFLGTSLLFWWVVIEPWPGRSPWSRWAAVPLLVTADLVNTALSAFLAFSNRVLYPTYAAAPRVMDLTPMQDQAGAGAFMWVIGSAIYWVPVIAIAFSLLSRRKPAPKGATHGLVAINGAPAAGTLLAPRQNFDLLRLPVLGALLRARYGRQSLQAISLALMALVIAHGLIGHPMASMNLAGVVPWNIARALGVLALLFLGNLFCMACPFTLPRELARRIGGGRLRWPAWLRLKWIGVALMLVFFFSYERFALWNTPALTAWLLIGYTGAAFAVDALFRGASFCKYVCPIGQFNFVGALLSPTTLRVRSQAVCASCTTHDCIRGHAAQPSRPAQRGCELDLYLPQKRSNADCTLCMDCVKACPHDNIGILPRSVTQDLLAPSPTSSLGRLSRRTDVALAALVLVFAAFANAAAMVAPGADFLARAGDQHPWLATATGSFTAVLAATFGAASLVWIVAFVFRNLTGTGTQREAFCRSALALVPLGMGMWAAHLLFHLAMSVSGLWPLLTQATVDFHLLAAVPNWNVEAPGPDNTLLSLQCLFLGSGLLVTLYVAWRMAESAAARLLRRFVAIAPLVLLAVAFYIAGCWLLLQPMQMRGMAMGGM